MCSLPCQGMQTTQNKCVNEIDTYKVPEADLSRWRSKVQNAKEWVNGQNQEKRKEKMNLEYGPVSPPQVSWLFSFFFFYYPITGQGSLLQNGACTDPLASFGSTAWKRNKGKKERRGEKINKGVFGQMQSVMRWKETPQMCSFPILALEEKEKKKNKPGQR